MTINKNAYQRQIPKAQKITSNPFYADLLYGYLQHICQIITDEDGDKRKIIPKREFKYTTAASALGLTRQTVSKRFKNLLIMGLVVEHEDFYELITLPNQQAFLVEFNTLGTLVSTLQEHCITIYVYLLNRYIANKEQPYDFYITSIKEYLNISKTNKHNNFLITETLNVLQRLGLIQYDISVTYKNNECFTTYKLNYATNKLPTC